MMPVLNVGGLAFQMRGLLLLAAFLVALWVAEEYARRRALPRETMWNAGTIALLVTLLAARLTYAAQHLSLYQQEPGALLSLTIQGMAWTEGVMLGLLAGAIYLHRKHVSLLDASDALFPALAAFWGLAGLSAFFSGDAYGTPTTMPWGVLMWGANRHPVQLYELFAGGVVMLLLDALWWRAPWRGWIALLGLAFLSIARLLVEGFRGDPLVLSGGVRVAQLWALTLALGALWLLYRAETRRLHVEPALPPRSEEPTE